MAQEQAAVPVDVVGVVAAGMPAVRFRVDEMWGLFEMATGLAHAAHERASGCKGPPMALIQAQRWVLALLEGSGKYANLPPASLALYRRECLNFGDKWGWFRPVDPVERRTWLAELVQRSSAAETQLELGAAGAPYAVGQEAARAFGMASSIAGVAGISKVGSGEASNPLAPSVELPKYVQAWRRINELGNVKGAREKVAAQFGVSVRTLGEGKGKWKDKAEAWERDQAVQAAGDRVFKGMSESAGPPA